MSNSGDDPIATKNPAASNIGAVGAAPVDAIGSQLRSMYDAYLSEPVPDSIISLLDRLDEIPAPEKPGRGGEDA